ncbi:FG-GAP-like repeat-containing protein [Vibrio sp. WXL210]|uniref:FG-GAP-like repeat-containing protein n=1 Tax=Vibrio sp. WXL210 TaxID=3450709 RepID=UPI003EC8CF59
MKKYNVISPVGIRMLALSAAILAGCNSDNSNGDRDNGSDVVSLPAQIEVGDDIDISVDVISPEVLQAFELDVEITSNFASISIMSGDTILIDNVDIPSQGEHKLRLVAQLPADKLTTSSSDDGEVLSVAVRNGTVTLKSVTATPLNEMTLPSFYDASSDIGLETEVTYKYGGPSVGDFEGNGFYDAVLNNHNFIAPQLMTNHSGQSVDVKPQWDWPRDYHGTALGDYTNNGHLDLMVAMGGANGTSPSSYILLKNEGGTFVEVENNAGINTPARGRAPRWVDLNNNGLLDLVLVNAMTPNYDGPQQLFYRNLGDGTFEQVRVAGIERAGGERVLVLDFNDDGYQDLMLFSPLSLWQNNGDFTFTDVTADWLPANVHGLHQVQAAADMDLTNNGLSDLYLSRGLPEYQLSRKSYDFNPTTKQFDVRDDGEKGETLVDLATDPGSTITLKNLELTYRQYNDGYPIYLGSDKDKKWVYAEGFQENQLHPDMKDAPHFLDISPADAEGWPEQRDQNGFYIGHLGDGQWKVEWVRDQNVYWMVGFTIENVNDVSMDWIPNNRNVNDILLINDGEKFVDASEEWNIPKGGNHWGVTFGDFNNNGWNDLFIHRYGFLKERIRDLLLINNGEGFEITTAHGAHDVLDPGHGDMGQAFDFDRNGRVDLLNGSNEQGKWYLYKNATADHGNFLNIDVGYSPVGNIDPMGAKVVIETASGTTPSHRVGSRGEVFSQGVMNLTHFGLDFSESVDKATVTWRNGEVVTFTKPSVNSTLLSANGDSPLPVSIELERDEKKLRVDEQYQLEPSFTPLNALTSVTYHSSNPAVATVDQLGNITGVSEGDATITVQSSEDTSVEQTIAISVGDFDPNYVTDIQIEHDGTYLYVGTEVELDFVLTASDPLEKPDDATVSWSSSDDSIARVSVDGKVTGVTEGRVDIVASANGSEQPNMVTDTISFDVEEYQSPFVVFDNTDWYYKTKANPIDKPLLVNLSYHAGSNDTLSGGIRVFFRLLENWQVVKDYNGQSSGEAFDVIAETIGTDLGTVTYELDLPGFAQAGLVPSEHLPENQFYYLYVVGKSESGEDFQKAVYPVCIVPPVAEGETPENC